MIAPSSAALQGLPGSHVLSEMKRLEVSIAKLQESNELLEEFLKGNEEDPSIESAEALPGGSMVAKGDEQKRTDDNLELQQAKDENEGVIRRQNEFLQRLRAEVDRRGGQEAMLQQEEAVISNWTQGDDKIIGSGDVEMG